MPGVSALRRFCSGSSDVLPAARSPACCVGPLRARSSAGRYAPALRPDAAAGEPPPGRINVLCLAPGEPFRPNPRLANCSRRPRGQAVHRVSPEHSQRDAAANRQPYTRALAAMRMPTWPRSMPRCRIKPAASPAPWPYPPVRAPGTDHSPAGESRLPTIPLRSRQNQ